MTAPNDTAPQTGAPDSIVIDSLGGLCPVQGTGTIDGVPFYFRARGDTISLEIGPGNTHLVVEAMHHASDAANDRARAAVEALGAWYYEAPYGEWPAAGYVEHDTARAFIASAANLWRTLGRPITPDAGGPA